MIRLATVLAIMAFLAVLAGLTVTAPITPNADDCAARGLVSDCWEDEAYDVDGHRVMTEGLRRKL